MPTYEEYEQAATPSGIILTRGSWDKMTDTGRQRLFDTASGKAKALLTYDELTARCATLEQQHQALRERAFGLIQRNRATYAWARTMARDDERWQAQFQKLFEKECARAEQAEAEREAATARATKAESRVVEVVQEILTEWRDNTLPDAGPDADSERRRLNHRVFFDIKCQQLTGRRLEPSGIYAGISAPAPLPSSPAAAPPSVASEFFLNGDPSINPFEPR